VTSLARLRPRLLACRLPRGERSGDLVIGPWRIRFEGIDAGLDAALAHRWGAFWGAPAGSGTVTVQVVRGDGGSWIPPGSPGELYRIEAEAEAAGILVASYRFALAPETNAAWRLAVEETPEEPLERIVENAARYLVARLAAETGGIALHGAGLARSGRAWIFAGPSRSGKSTAVSHSPGVSLGDDYAVVLPGSKGWIVPAVPFDNAESGSVASTPPMPLARILRLRHATTPRLERLSGPRAQASLMGCVAFPWALPDLAGPIDAAVASLVAAGLFAELQLAPNPSFWDELATE